MIKVLIKRPGKSAEVKAIQNELRSLQKAVGGPIQILPIGSGVVLICHEEGKLERLPFNFFWHGDSIVGPVLFAKDGEDGELVSLDEMDVQQIMCKVGFPMVIREGFGEEAYAKE